MTENLDHTSAYVLERVSLLDKVHQTSPELWHHQNPTSCRTHTLVNEAFTIVFLAGIMYVTCQVIQNGTPLLPEAGGVLMSLRYLCVCFCFPVYRVRFVTTAFLTQPYIHTGLGASRLNLECDSVA